MTIIEKIKAAKRPCLVLQGGGMRGSYTTGVLQVFEEMGLRKHFKYIVGESAGALNGAYFKTGQGTFDDGFGLYINYLTNTNFVNLKNFPRIMGIDYLVDVVKHKQPIMMYNLIGGEPELHVCITDKETLEPQVITSESPHVLDAIFASMSVPIVYNGSFNIEGREYIDGGVAHAVPYEYALTLDADLYIIVLTNPVRYRYSDNRIKTVTLNTKFAASKYSKDLLKAVDGMDEKYNEALTRIEVDSHHYQNVEALFPSNVNRLVSMLETRKQKLMDCQRMGHQDAKFFLESNEEPKIQMKVPDPDPI